MNHKKQSFNKLSINDKDSLDELSRNASFKAYRKMHADIATDFEALSGKKKPQCSYWLHADGSKPTLLIITRDVSTTQPDYMTPWIEPETQTLWIDLIPLRQGELDANKGAELFTAFLGTCPKEVGALLADPEVKQESHLALYELVGFARVSTFIKGQGFFKGSPHYLLKLKRSSS